MTFVTWVKTAPVSTDDGAKGRLGQERNVPGQDHLSTIWTDQAGK